MNLVFSTRTARISLAALALIGAGIVAPRLANAADLNVTFTAPVINLTAAQGAAGTSGYFDVTITDSASESISAFQSTIALAGDGSQVAFVGADYGNLSNPYAENGFGDGIGDAPGSSPNLLFPYAFAGNSSDITNSANVSWDSNDVENSDLTNSGLVALTANTVYATMQVYYTVAPGTLPGSYAITFNTNAPFNSISNPGGDPTADFVSLAANNNTNGYVQTNSIAGSINITPEPASVVMMLFGAVGLIGYGLRRARRA